VPNAFPKLSIALLGLSFAVGGQNAISQSGQNQPASQSSADSQTSTKPHQTNPVAKGATDVGKGTAKGVSTAGKDVGKGATDVGKGSATAGKDIGKGTAKGATKVAKGTSHGVKKVVHPHSKTDDASTAAQPQK